MANNGGIYIPVTIGMDGAGDIALAQYKRIQTQFDSIYKTQLAKMKNSYRSEIQQLTNDIKAAQAIVDESEKKLSSKSRGTASYREAKKELAEAQSILKSTEKSFADFNASLEKSAASFATQQVTAKEAMASSSDSINGMTAKIKAYETELNSLAVGSQAWQTMAQKISAMKTELSLMSIQTKQATTDALASVQVYQVLGNTLSALEGQLAGWNTMLKDVEIGSNDFKLMAEQAGRLDRSIASANAQIKIFGAESGSMAQYSAILSDLNRKWQELGAARKFVNGKDASAGYTAEAQKLIDEFRATKEAAELTGDSLDQIISRERQLAEEAKRAGEQMAAALQKTRNIINSNVYSLDAMEAKLRLLEKHHSRQRLFSSAWFETKAAIEQTTVELERARAQIQIMGTAAGSIDRLNLKIQQLRTQWNAMGAAQKFDASGKLTAQADALLTKYKQVTAELKKQGISLEELASEESVRLNQLNVQTQKLNFSFVKMLTKTAAFSAIFSAGRLVKNVREITAEFQLQQVALGSIIQDMDRAESLFGQIKAAAIESPFEIKDLVTYTKQLSAYQIETEKLFGTMMKLADVSAGLGVDMNRIILAYGQVKAASVLRGQELRQFTEAGIPLVDLLAKKFSTLRGELVSNAEVFDMISKRLVPFSMIDEIFDDMTSAGGMFYQMQEKQAETLAGQWANLKDSVSIMYSEIGNTKSVFHAMEGIIKLIRKMTDNWKSTANVINASLVAMLAYKIATKSLTIETTKLTAAELSKVAAEEVGTVTVGGLTKKIIGKTAAEKLSTFATNQATKAYIKQQMATTLLSKAFWRLYAAIMANPYALAIGLVIGLGAALVGMVTRTKSAAEAVEDLNRATEGYAKTLRDGVDLEDMINKYEELSNLEEKTAEQTQKLANITKELAKQYPLAVEGIDEETGALKLNVVELRKKSKEEQQIYENRLRYQIQEDKRQLKKETQRRDRLNQKLLNSKREVTISEGDFSSSFTVDKYSGKKYEKMAVKLDEATENVNNLDEAIQNAEKALEGLEKNGEKTTDVFFGWRSELQKMQREVVSTGETIGLYSDSEIENFTDIEEVLKDAAKQQKEYQEKADRATKAARGKTGEEKENLEAEANQYQKNADAYMSVLDRWDARDLLDKNNKGGRRRLDNLMEEVSLLEKVYRKYQDYSEIMTREDAKAKTGEYFGDTIKKLQFGAAFTPEDLAKILLKYKALAQALPDSAKEVLEIGFKADDALWEDEKERIENKLKKLAEDVSRSEAAKNFFDDILSQTGNRQLAADMTIAVYGGVGDDLKENMKKQIEDAFEGIDVSGAIDTNTLAVDYRKLAEIYREHESEIEKKNRGTAKALIDNGLKVSAEQIKNWYKELEAAETYSKKRVDLARVTAERVKEVMDSDIPQNEKDALIKQYRDREAKEAAKLEYDAFKDSPMYVQLFEDLDNASYASLTNMRDRIEELKDQWQNLDPTQLKELSRRLNELNAQIAKKNPFRSLSDAIERYKVLAADGTRRDAEVAAENAATKREQAVRALGDALAAEAVAESNYDDAVRKFGKDAPQAIALQKELNKKREDVAEKKDAADAAKNAADEAQKTVGSWREVFYLIAASLEGMKKYITIFNELSESTIGLLDSLGVENDVLDLLHAETSAISKMLSGGVSIGSGLGQVLSGDYVEGIKNIVSGTIDTIAAASDMITGAKIFKANREIERQEKLLNDLERSYERLEAAQAKAFGTDYIDNYSARLAALVAEQEAYEKQAEAERSKGKKADEDKIQDYEEAAEDTANKIKDMSSELSEFFTDMDVTSAAKEFAQAWLDAYMEFGNTADAIKEKFGDMIQNMVINSLMAKVVQTVLQPIFDSIDEMATDGELSSEEIASIADRIPQAIADIDNGLSNVVKDLQASGVNLRQTGGNLTGISRDIASASEESILGLAAGINTQNFYISQIHANVAQILLLMQGNGAQLAQTAVSGTSLMVENPFLTQYLPSIDQHTANIEAYCAETLATLNKVIKPRGTQGAFVVNSSIS